MSPVELARRLGISVGESTSLVCLLAAQGRVKVRLVEIVEEEAGPAVPPVRKRREALQPRA
jgi:hypothetical protein